MKAAPTEFAFVVAFSTAFASAAAAYSAAPGNDWVVLRGCDTGPVHKRFGDVSWVFSSCADGSFSVETDDQPVKANRGHFLAFPSEGGYLKSCKAGKNARACDLIKLTDDDVRSLIQETRSANSVKPH